MTTKIKYNIKLIDNQKPKKEKVITKNLELVITNDSILLKNQNNHYNLFGLDKKSGTFIVYYDNNYNDNGTEFTKIKDNNTGYTKYSEFKLVSKGEDCDCCSDDDDDEFEDDWTDDDDDENEEEDCSCCDGDDDNKINNNNTVDISFRISDNNK